MKKIWGRARRKDANGLTDEQYLRAAADTAGVEFGPVTQEADMLVLHVACDQLNLRDSRAA